MGSWPLARIKNFSWPLPASMPTVVGPGFDQADGTPGVRTKGTGDSAASRTPSDHHDVEVHAISRNDPPGFSCWHHGYFILRPPAELGRWRLEQWAEPSSVALPWSSVLPTDRLVTGMNASVGEP